MILYHGSYMEVSRPDTLHSRAEVDFDKVFNTVELFFDGLIDIEEAIKRLRYEKPNAQLAFRSQSVLETYLSFERSWQL